MHFSFILLGAYILAFNGVKSENNILSHDKLIKKKQNEKETTSAREIIGGEETIPGRYPYMVGLLPNCNTTNPICGGTLIAPQWVLSAAHCLGDIDRVDIGRHDRSNSSEIYETIDVAFATKHPNYNIFTYENDIMLIRLKEPSKNTPIALSSTSDDLQPGSETTVMGWGVTTDSFFFFPEPSDVLLEVGVDIVSNELCNSGAAYNGAVTDDMICAGRPGKDSCQGDSGGPLFKKGENATMDSQVGIVSWGRGCADPLYPGVYASVLSGLDFIESAMSCNTTDIDEDCCEAFCMNGVYKCVSTSCTNFGCPGSFPEDGFDYENCNVGAPHYVGDGFCDDGDPYNTAECNYDGGDCCEDTCLSGSTYICGSGSFNCKDPNSEFTNDALGGIFAIFFEYFSTIASATFDFFIQLVTIVLS